jgi:hypothetical protein
MSMTVVIREITTGPEAARILDELDEAVEYPGDRLSNGRRYSLYAVNERATAVAALEAELDRISSDWQDHVAIHAIA